MKVIMIAMVAHAAQLGFCEGVQDASILPWEELSKADQKAVIDNVEFLIENLGSGADSLHNKWCEEMEKDGWVRGEETDEEKREHASLVPFSDLPQDRIIKDHVFYAVVQSCSGIPDTEVVVQDAPLKTGLAQEKNAPVKYVGPRDSHTEGAYNSGVTWMAGETLMVPVSLAKKLLRHPDVFAVGLIEDAGIAKVTGKVKEDDREPDHDHLDLINTIRATKQKQPIIDLINTNFQGLGDNLDKTMKVAELQKAAVALIDRFGTV